MQAGAAEAALLDEADVQAGGRPVEGRRVAGRATTDHDQVVPDGHEAITTWTVKATSRPIPQASAERINMRVLTSPTVTRLASWSVPVS